MKNMSDTIKKAKQKPWLVITMAVCYCICSSNANFVFASTDNLNLSVSATISPKCIFKAGTSGQTVSFGSYSAIAENETEANNSSSGFDAKCTKNTTSQVAMGSGLYAGYAIGTSRAMSDGAGNYLSYEIYSDPAMSNVWNDSNTVSYTDHGGNSTTLPIYASIPPGQDVVVGSYSDTVTMTISY